MDRRAHFQEGRAIEHPALVLAMVAVAAVLLALAVVPAQAALIRNGTDATVAASAGDLLQTSLDGAAALTGNWAGEGASGAPGALTDGVAVFAGGGTPPRYKQEKNTYGAPSDNATVTFTLDTSTNTQGYDIMQIDFYHGWGDDGRDGFEFKIEYATVGDPNTFINYGTTPGKYDPPSNYGRSEVTDSTGTIATGVAKIRITPTSIDAGYGGLSEIDVFPVPEPASLALVALGGLGMLLRRKRRQAGERGLRSPGE